jgi:hypothetical protein
MTRTGHDCCRSRCCCRLWRRRRASASSLARPTRLPSPPTSPGATVPYTSSLPLRPPAPGWPRSPPSRGWCSREPPLVVELGHRCPGRRESNHMLMTRITCSRPSHAPSESYPVRVIVVRVIVVPIMIRVMPRPGESYPVRVMPCHTCPIRVMPVRVIPRTSHTLHDQSHAPSESCHGRHALSELCPVRAMHVRVMSESCPVRVIPIMI